MQVHPHNTPCINCTCLRRALWLCLDLCREQAAWSAQTQIGQPKLYEDASLSFPSPPVAALPLLEIDPVSCTDRSARHSLYALASTCRHRLPGGTPGWSQPAPVADALCRA